VSVRPGLIRLNASHFVILSGGVGLLLFFLGSLWEPFLGEMYARGIGLPAIEKRYGFTYGDIQSGPGFNGMHTFHGIVDLERDGVLARLGLRVHDIPWTWNETGGASWDFYMALRAIDRGDAASIVVVNLHDLTTPPGSGPRRIEIPARR
jgi:hypothetical protein